MISRDLLRQRHIKKKQERFIAEWSLARAYKQRKIPVGRSQKYKWSRSLAGAFDYKNGRN